MGLFGNAFSQARHGANRRIVCQTCGSTYNGNISNDFPYAVCGRCLEREEKRAYSSGNTHMYHQIKAEQNRRERSFFM